MKKIFLFLIIPFILLGFNKDTIYLNIQKENKIVNYINKYILDTSLLPNKNDLVTKYNLDLNLFNNLYNQKNIINFSITNNVITLTDILNTNTNKISNDNKYYYKLLSINGKLSSDLSSKTFPLSSKVINLLTIKDDLSTNEILSETEPTDVTIKYWYKPNGDGSYTTFERNDDNKFIEKYDKIKESFIDINNFDINSTCISNSKIQVIGNNSASVYYCYKGKWINIDKVNNDSIINNDTTIGNKTLYNVVCQDTMNINSKENNVSVYPFNITKNFTKNKGDNNYNNYWKSDDEKDIIIVNLNDLLHYSNSTLENGYFCFNNKVVQVKKLNVNGVENWVVLAKDYYDLLTLSLNTTNYIGNNWFLSWDYLNSNSNSVKQFFKISPTIMTNKANNVFISSYDFDGNNNTTINNKIQIGLNKDKFTNFVNLGKYYTFNSDCNNQCNGNNTGNSNVFGGEKIDNLYLWYWDATNNKFVDAKTIDNFYELYEKNYNATYINNENKLYYKKNDINGNDCYVDNNNNWYTYNNQKIPTMYIKNNKPNFPLNKNCKNVIFNNNNYMVLDNRNDIVKWTNADVNTVVVFNNETYTKMDSNKDYWESSKEILTQYSRENLPSVTNNNKKYLTLLIGTDNDYYDSSQLYRFSKYGLKYKKDNNFYQWVYISNSSKSLNNLIDADCNNESYGVNVCDLEYNGVKFNYNNDVCSIPLNDTFCPIIDTIQTKYDFINNNCYVNIKDENCPTDYEYSNDYHICYQYVCPSDLTFNTQNNRCEKTYICKNGGTYDNTKHQCVYEISPGQYSYENVDCKEYSQSENICFKDVSTNNLSIINNRYINTDNVNLLTGMSLDTDNNKMVITLNPPDINNLNNTTPNTLNISDFSNVILDYDYNNDVLYYIPNENICTNALYNNEIPSPFYKFYDGICYSNIGEQCKNSY